MPIENRGHEHEFEPQFGLPERLPADEAILWQGSPRVGVLLTSAFHFRKLIFYFSALILACAWPALEQGAGVVAVLQGIKWIAPLAVMALLGVWTLAWMTAQTTVYTLTNKRVVMRLGIVLTVTYNLPLKQIKASDVRALEAGAGDITLALKGSDRIAWVQLWPSVRPWRLTQPEPTLRAIGDVAEVAAQLSAAWISNAGMDFQSPVKTPRGLKTETPAPDATHWEGSLT